MKLPNASLALVERQKIEGYLLNASHPDNGGKAQFFTMMGFDVKQWEILATALRQMAANIEVVTSLQSTHGEKYILEGENQTPCGRRACAQFGS